MMNNYFEVIIIQKFIKILAKIIKAILISSLIGITLGVMIFMFYVISKI